MKKTFCTLLAIGALSGCATTAQPTLEEKLAGRSPAERTIILKQECMDEADWRIWSKTSTRAAQSMHIKRMQAICAAYDKEIKKL